jgi:hypothetical protein
VVGYELQAAAGDFNRFERRFFLPLSRLPVRIFLVCFQAIVITGESAAGLVLAFMITMLLNVAVQMHAAPAVMHASPLALLLLSPPCDIHRIIIARSEPPQDEPMLLPHV